MTNAKAIRVRFAPSPTGPLHIGGVRTALYNYLFAKKKGGQFILRIEDTDQSRFVPGAEEYILNALEWLGLDLDESVRNEGNYGPYRQSDRRAIYDEHIKKLIANGTAYYAFDTTQELEKMREDLTAQGIHSPKYDGSTRLSMKNSLSLNPDEVEKLLRQGKNITVRMKIPIDETIVFEDEIRGQVEFSSNELDDKVIMKADGLPTYHVANVIDDRLMAISHVIRGEEWLSSTAHHVLLYRSFGWEEEMPSFAHLPLILKPTGQGKLSKRDGAKFGFPVFPMDWNDENEAEKFEGFKEKGFLPGAVLNFLALLGWSPGTDQEIFDIQSLSKAFSLENINKSGAQFNYDKAKWFNQQYILALSLDSLYELTKDQLPKSASKEFILEVVRMLQPRVEYLTDFEVKSAYFFAAPQSYDDKTLLIKYKPEIEINFLNISQILSALTDWTRDNIELAIKSHITDNKLKFGEIFPILRILMTGTMEGPDLFDIIKLLGQNESKNRIVSGLNHCKKISVESKETN